MARWEMGMETHEERKERGGKAVMWGFLMGDFMVDGRAVKQIRESVWESG